MASVSVVELLHSTQSPPSFAANLVLALNWFSDRESSSAYLPARVRRPALAMSDPAASEAAKRSALNDISNSSHKSSSLAAFEKVSLSVLEPEHTGQVMPMRAGNAAPPIDTT